MLADAADGIDYVFRQSQSDLGLHDVVGLTVVVWPPDLEPLPPKPYCGMGRPPVMRRRTAKRQPVNVKALAQSLPDSAFHNIRWREDWHVFDQSCYLGTVRNRDAAVALAHVAPRAFELDAYRLAGKALDGEMAEEAPW